MKTGIGIGIGYGTFKKNGPSPAVISADFTARVVANGGSLSPVEQSAVLQLVIDLMSSGVWNKMKYIYPMVGGSAASCAVNLVNSSYKGTFSSGWSFSNFGALPSGSNCYMNTGFIPSVVFSDASNTSWSYYSRTDDASNGFELGAQNGFVITDRIAMSSYYTGLNYSNMNNFDVTGQISNTATNTDGLYVMTRTSSTNHQFFRKGVQLGATNVNTMTTPLPTSQITIGAINFNDGVSYVSTDRECAFTHSGLGLTSAQVVAFDTNVQTFQTSLGRQV
jgi:hypothetical protein